MSHFLASSTVHGVQISWQVKVINQERYANLIWFSPSCLPRPPPNKQTNPLLLLPKTIFGTARWGLPNETCSTRPPSYQEACSRSNGTAACDVGQACFWFSSGCTIGWDVFFLFFFKWSAMASRRESVPVPRQVRERHPQRSNGHRMDPLWRWLGRLVHTCEPWRWILVQVCFF